MGVGITEQVAVQSTVLSRIQEELSHIDHLHTLIASAQSEISERKASIACYTSSVHYSSNTSPIYSLPSEIIIAIFREYLSLVHTVQTDLFVVHPHFFLPLTNLTHVCRLWRRLAISTADLWARMDVFIPEEADADAVARYVTGVKVFLERARPSGRVVLNAQDNRGCRGNRRLRAILLDMLLEHDWRGVQSVSLGLPYDHFNDLIPENNSGTVAPQLTEVYFVPAPHNPTELGYPFMDLKETNLPWSQLVNLHISSLIVDLHALKSVLSQCTTLTQCSARAEYEEEEAQQPEPEPPTTLPSLQFLTLKIAQSPTENSALLFAALTLPALSHLALHYDEAFPDPLETLPSLIALQLRSNYSLTTLALSGLSPSLASLTDLLVLSPDLSALSLDACWENPGAAGGHDGTREAVLRVLTWRAPSSSVGDRTLALKLASFSMWMRDPAMPWEELRRLVQSRWWAVCLACGVVHSRSGGGEGRPPVRMEAVGFARHGLFDGGVVERWRREGLGVCLLDGWSDDTVLVVKG